LHRIAKIRRKGNIGNRKGYAQEFMLKLLQSKTEMVPEVFKTME
jgi:hypothetical protein